MKQVSKVLNHEETTDRRGCLHAMVTSKRFDLVSGFVILVNTVFIIMGTNAMIEEASSVSGKSVGFIDFHSEVAHLIDAAFLLFYFCELCLRLYVHRILFFFNQDACWNMLDFVLVFASIAGVVVGSYQGHGYKSNSGVLAMRTTRLAKLAKLLRVVRAVRFFKQLQVFVDVVLACYEPLFWAVLMVLLVLLLFAIFFVQSFEGWISDNWNPEAPEEVQTTVAGIQQNFGSVQIAMLTMFKTVSGGADWEVFYDLVETTGAMNCTLFLSMLIFFAVAVWNIVASVFVENTIKAATIDREEQVLAQHRADIDDAKELMQLCRSADIDKSGSISREEFEKFMDSPLIREFFLIRGLDIKNAAHFFEMMNQVTDGDEVDLEQFVGSCLRVKGAATSIDLHMLAFETRTMATKTKNFFRFAHGALYEQTMKMNRLLGVLAAAKDPGTLLAESPGNSNGYPPHVAEQVQGVAGEGLQLSLANAACAAAVDGKVEMPISVVVGGVQQEDGLPDKMSSQGCAAEDTRQAL
eukprot:TRINITY_DN8618_c0_g1_i3.p1 TRINITY_DN8618_c0_g1~~TRINITY_DN8618_c0_g1_i3.p1  ORF type:complete len:549 (-),score=88.75 TRINITY_DN8618_c0_g1_i3:160-1728(-)